MIELPESWVSIATLNCFEQISTNDKKVKTKECLESGLYPVIDQGQSKVAGFLNDPDKVIHVEEPLIIFGDHTRVVKWVTQNFIPGADGTKVLSPKAFVDNRFAYFQLKSLDIPDRGYSRHFQFLKAMPFSIPPLNEQIRIANKLDSLLAKVHAAQTSLEKIPTLLQRFRHSVLAAATSGELTREWREQNKTIELVNDLLNISGDRAKVISRRDAVPKNHLKNEEYKIPDTWSWVSLDMLASKIVDGVHFKPDYIESGIPFISVKDIKGGKISFDNCKYISLETHHGIHPRCNPERGDLLITKSGTIGRTAIVDTDEVFDLFVSVALIKPASPLVNLHFVDIALQKWINSIDISSRVIGTAIKNLHLQDMRVLAIPFPPLEEQKEIVRRTESLFALVDSVEKHYTEAKKRTDRLTQSLLAKAFRGELVPQDPNDEPASELLKRIQAKREQAATIKPKSKKTKPDVKSATKAKDNVITTPADNRTFKIDTIREKYSRVLADTLNNLKGSQFSIEQFKSVSGFSGDYEALKALILNLLSGISDESEPLLTIDSWNEKTGEYRLRVKDVK